MRKITHLTIHCTDSPDSADKIGISDVRRWHKQKGWSDIGYHWLVDKRGDIFSGRAEDIQGAGVQGHNKYNIHMVWVGRDVCNINQWASLVAKAAEIVMTYNIPIENVLGHCEYPGVTKTCPNINMTQFRNAVQQQLNKPGGQCG